MGPAVGAAERRRRSMSIMTTRRAVRDLLVLNCNGGLGQFRNDPAVLRAAARWVEARRAGQAGVARR